MYLNRSLVYSSPGEALPSRSHWTYDVIKLQLGGAAQVALDAPPMSCLVVAVSVPSVCAGERAEVEQRALVGDRLETSRWELWVEDPLSVSWVGSPTLLVGQPGTLRARLANNTREDMQVEIACVSDDIHVQPALTRIRLRANSSSMLTVQAECATTGRRQIVWGVRSTDSRYGTEVDMPVDVVQATFRVRSDGLPVLPLSAHLRLDMLTPTGTPDMRFPNLDGSSRQMRNRPIRLNGTTIG